MLSRWKKGRISIDPAVLIARRLFTESRPNENVWSRRALSTPKSYSVLPCPVVWWYYYGVEAATARQSSRPLPLLLRTHQSTYWVISKYRILSFFNQETFLLVFFFFFFFISFTTVSVDKGSSNKIPTEFFLRIANIGTAARLPFFPMQHSHY